MSVVVVVVSNREELEIATVVQLSLLDSLLELYMLYMAFDKNSIYINSFVRQVDVLKITAYDLYYVIYHNKTATSQDTSLLLV